MIWSGWFPLFLAVAATLMVIMVPLRRAQTAVAQPSAATDWAPSAPPAASMMGSMAPTVAMPTSPPPYVPAPTSPAARSDYRTETIHEPDAPPTSLLPQSELPVRPASGAEPSDMAATRRMDTITPSAPIEGNRAEPSPFTTSSFSTGSDSSWLLASTQNENPPATSGTSESATPPSTYGLSDHPAPTESAGTTAVTTGTEKKCSNCGSPLAPGALFCTECGTRVS